MPTRFVLVGIVAALAASASAAPPMLLSDFRTHAVNASFSPTGVHWAQGSALPSDLAIIRSSQVNVFEAYITDGSAAGTRRITGLPATWSAGLPTQPSVTAARVASGRTVIAVQRTGNVRTLYALDVPGARAAPILDISGGSPLPAGDRFVFVNDDGATGSELWVTMGDPAAPSANLLVELVPGADSARPALLTSNGQRVYFTMVDQATGATSLAWTDGTPAGTRTVGPVHPTRPTAAVERAAALGQGLLYLVAEPGGSTYRAYFTDGQTPAAAPLTTSTGQTLTAEPDLLSTGNRVLFGGSDTTRHLFTTDGTTTGTRAISESAIPSGGAYVVVPDTSSPLGWRVFFGAGPANPRVAYEPAVSDGTRAGTGIIADLNPGEGSSGPVSFIALGDRVYFNTSNTVTQGVPYTGSLFETDGTTEGTTDLVAAGGAPGVPATLAAVGGRLLVSGFDVRGSEPWVFDPVTRQFSLVADLRGEVASSAPSLWFADDDLAILSATIATPDQPTPTGALVRSDGTVPGTTVLLRSNASVMLPGAVCYPVIGRFGDDLAVYLRSAATGDEPHLLNMVNGEVTLLQDVNSGPTGSASTNCSLVSPALQFGTPTRAVLGTTSGGSTGGPALWSTQGVPGDFTRIAEFRSAISGPLFNLVEFNGPAYFFAPPRLTDFPPSSDIDLWVTDGTAAGTSRAVSLQQIGARLPTFLYRLGNRLIIGAVPASSSSLRLYGSDGTPGGTSLLSLHPALDAQGILAATPTSLGLVVVTSIDNASRRGLWLTDGTAAGTVELAPPIPWARDTPVLVLADAGGRIYFTRWSAEVGNELWVSDGTPSGTRVAADLAPGVASSSAANLLAIPGGRVLFTAETPERGNELWQSDGTAFGTRLVADLNPGPASILAAPLSVVDGRALISLDDGSPIGRELWGWTVVPPCRADVNNNGASDVQDLFDFLALYFSGRGDFNADGVTSVQDIFSFLGEWFAGCS